MRLIAATHRNLPEMIETGAFRDDLYYRLNVVTLNVPPLRERREDVPLLALCFLRRYASELDRQVTTINPAAMAMLKAYPWPGNVRELQNVIERGVLFCPGTSLEAESLPDMLHRVTGVGPAPEVPALELGRPLPELLEEAEKELIRKALIQTRGVQAQAAELLGLSRSNLQYKLKKYGMI